MVLEPSPVRSYPKDRNWIELGWYWQSASRCTAASPFSPMPGCRTILLSLWFWWPLAATVLRICSRRIFGKCVLTCRRGSQEGLLYYPGTEETHTNPTRQRGECLRALAGA